MHKNYQPQFFINLFFFLFLLTSHSIGAKPFYDTETSSYSLLSEKERTIPYLPFFVNETTDVQFIHNAPDPNLATVDIYVNGTIFLNDVEFRTASAFTSVPANEDLDIAIAPSTSQDASEAFFNTTVNLLDTEKYIIVANGVQNTSNFDASVNTDIQFSLDVFEGARETAIAVAGNTDILVHHGATDLANVDVDETTIPIPNFISNLAYSTYNDYIQIATNNYTIQPKLTSTQEEFEAYDLPLLDLGLQNTAVTLLASGFVDRANNQNGPEFGLWLALPEGGELIELPFEGECITSQTPFLEDFSGENWEPGSQFQNIDDSIDECWTRIPQNIQNVYAWGTGDSSTQNFLTGPDDAFQGDNFIYTKASGNPDDEAQFISPIISTDNLNTPVVSFYYFMFGEDIASLEVEVREFGTQSWESIFSVDGEQQASAADNWLEQEIELANYTNTKIQIRFTATRGPGFSSVIALDLIEVREATVCLEPSNLSVSQIGETSAQLNWNQQTNPVDWLIYPAGANPETATPVLQSSSSISSNNTQVSNLTSNTSYDAYLRSNCAQDGLSDLEGPVEFTTAACQVSEQCEFTFNLIDDFGDDWNGAIIELRQDGQLVANLGESFVNGGDNFTETHLLCTGSFIELIWVDGGNFPQEVGLNVVNPFDEQIFELGFESQNLVGSTIFSFTSACTPPTCPEVTNVQVSNIEQDSANLSWNAEPEASSGYSWFIFDAGVNPLTSTPVLTESVDQNTTNVTVSGLSPSQAYDVYVVANCTANDASDFSELVSFSTLTCEATDTCAYTFELIDSFGDGWNGNTMTVFQNGVEVAVLGESFTSGNNFTETVNLCNNVNVELFWNTGGNFASEVGVTVFNPFDEEVYQNNPGEGSQGNTLTTFTSDCDAPDGCFPPLNFEVVEVTSGTVELSWDNIGSAISGYNWFVFNEDDDPQNTPPVASGSINFEVNSVLISGLSENTNYKAFIRSDCGFTGVSSASDPLFFKTLCNQPEVPTLSVSPATVCNGDIATLNITGTFTDVVTWRIYTDSCDGTEIGTTTTGTFAFPNPITEETTFYVSGEGGCVNPDVCESITIIPTELDDPSFSYSASTYLSTDADPTPTVTGTAGGSFSSTAGLSIDPSTGAIDVSASTPGTYTVTYTTAGTCPNSTEVIVTIVDCDLQASIETFNETCPGQNDGALDLSITGGTSPYTFLWSNGAITEDIDNLALGTYSVTITDDNGCETTASATITAEDAEDPVLNCLSNQTITLSSDQSDYTLPDYVVNADVTATDNCNVSSITQTPAAGTVLAPDVYTISFTATDDSGNTSNCSLTLTVDETLGTSSVDLGDISLYPNPADQLVIINNAQQHELKEILLYDIRGRRVMQVNLNSNASSIRLDVSLLASATYIVVLKSETSQVIRRLIKK